MVSEAHELNHNFVRPVSLALRVHSRMLMARGNESFVAHDCLDNTRRVSRRLTPESFASIPFGL